MVSAVTDIDWSYLSIVATRTPITSRKSSDMLRIWDFIFPEAYRDARVAHVEASHPNAPAIHKMRADADY
jgi:hypothetical protein